MMTSSTIYVLPDDDVASDTSVLRYFALAKQLDLLKAIFRGRILVPREILDPDDDSVGQAGLRSEIGHTELYWEKRSKEADAADYWARVRRIRTLMGKGIEIVDLDASEIETAAYLQGRGAATHYGLAAALGAGESAVIALAEHRGWAAAMDEGAGRRVLGLRVPTARTYTCVDLLRAAVPKLIKKTEASAIYEEMLDRHYRGPASLY